MAEIRCSYTELVPAGKLKPHPENPHKHSDEQIDRLTKLIEYQGIRHPVIVSKKSGFIVVGHGRLESMKRAGLSQIPVDYQDFESDAQEYEFIVSDNAIGKDEWAALDVSMISKQIDIMPISIPMLGLKNFEIKKLEPQADEDEVPEVKEPLSVLGDVYEIGNHRLMCGDSTSIDAVEKLMNGEKADMVFTDPPYGVSYTGGHNEKKRQGIQNDTLQGDSLTDLFCDALVCAEAVTQEHAAFYIWYANGKAVETFASFSKLNLKVRAVICWYKVKSGLGAFMSQYIPNYEPCIYAHKDGYSPQWFGPNDEKTVWELKKERVNEFHPTQKPIELPERAISNSSKSNDIVLDLFGGSGSTLIACEKTNRKCFMMELDPHYCDVIVSRWCKYTGQTKIKRNGEEVTWNV